MFNRRFALGGQVVAIIGFLASLGLSPSAASASPCDRDCLTGLMTRYVDALVAGDPSRLALASDVRVTEDSKLVKLGEGLWKEGLSKGPFRQDYIDTEKQVAAAHVQVMKDKKPILLSVVLHVKDSKVAGIETLAERITPESHFHPKVLDKPIRGMNDPIPAGQKETRAELVRIALTYTKGLRIGSFVDAGVPFAPETYRVENGVITAGKGCGNPECAMYTQIINLHPTATANVAAVDEKNGVVLLWMNFGFPSVLSPSTALVTFEAFKIWGGQIHSINAFFTALPINSARNWPTTDRVP